MKRFLLLALLVMTFTAAALPARAEEPGRYGSLWLGPRVGLGLGFAGPRAGYLVGLELSYRTPFYFYYNLEVGFLEMLPRTIDVAETTQDETLIAPEHEARVKGLFGIPITLEIGLRFARERLRFRVGVGFGAMVSIQTLEALGSDESEVISSFCFRPGLGLDVITRSERGMIRIDLMYLWQDANFEITGNDRDVDSLWLTFGYSWQVAG